MKKQINPTDILEIEYDYRYSKMKIFNKKRLLIFDKCVSEVFFNKSVGKFLKELEK